MVAVLSVDIAMSQPVAPKWPDLAVGEPIRGAVDSLRAAGLQIAYSIDDLDDSVVLRTVPSSSDAIEALREALRPYGLSVLDVDGLLAIGAADAPHESPAHDQAPEVETNRNLPDEIVVAASHYHMVRDLTSLPIVIDQRTIIEFPDVGDDPIRSIARLPGVASSGTSARTHVRGATTGQTGVFLDGHRLLDPFHIRDYQSLFSAIDVRAIDSMEVYTGGFPIEYGDLAGGLIVVDTVDVDIDRYTALGLSVFSSSVLSYGRVADGVADWTFSARRGNLDLVLKPEVGEPSYYDIFARISLRPTDRSRISLSGLLLDDNVLVIPAADPDEREESRNDTRNVQVWLTWDQTWSERLSSSTFLSASDLLSDRVAFVNDPETIVGNIDDRRDVSIFQISQQWRASVGRNHVLRFGAEYRHQSGAYDYVSDYSYFELFRDTLTIPSSGTNAIQTERDGDTIAAHLASRWRFGDQFALDLGIRWDKQTYTDLANNSQWSPRISALYTLDDTSRLRASWGRFHQSQGINELQVEDGVNRFYPAQRSDHLILGYERDLGRSHRIRLEAYDKSESSIIPRFENTLDPFSIVPELQFDRTLISPESGRARGLELSYEYSDRDAWRWWAVYTLARVDERENGREVPRSWDQRHAFQLGAAYSGDRWGFSAALKTHSGWPKTDVFLIDVPADGSQEVVFGPRNAERYDTFVTLDLRLDYRRETPRGTFSWFFEVANSTNRDNPCCVDFDLDPGLNGRAVLDKKEDYWFPLLPATGILWEF